MLSDNSTAMSLINANIAAPINAAVALNVLSDDGDGDGDPVRRHHPEHLNQQHERKETSKRDLQHE